MTKRILKFRAWDKDKKRMMSWEQILESEKTLFFVLVKWANLLIPMQFTGLLDSKGKEIYEGDILGYGSATSEVKYIQELAIYDDIFGLGFASMANQSEIIGNIYEDSHLLDNK